MFAAERKRLAGRAAAHEIDLAFVRPKIVIAHVALDRVRPMRDRRYATRFILPDCVATPAIPFDHFDGLEAGLGDADSEAAGSGEEFDSLQAPSRNVRIVDSK